MNVKKHSFALVTGFVFLVVAGGVGYWLFSSRGKFVEAKSKLSDAESQFTRLSDGMPYPSDANVELEKENLAKIQAFHAELEALLCAGQIRPQVMEHAEFPERLEEMYKSLREVATNRSVRLPAEFFFGFEAYVDQLPADEDVSRLTVQAQVIERLCGLLFTNKISTLESIKREQFEKGLSSTGGMGDRFGRGEMGMFGMDEFGGGEPAEDLGFEDEGNGLYATEHLDVLFTARDEHVWSVLDALGSSDLFVVVTSVEIESSTSGEGGGASMMRSGMRGGGTRGGFGRDEFMEFGGGQGFGREQMYNPRSRRTQPSGRTSRLTPDGDLRPEDVPHEDRVVAGREEFATVQLGLDVYRFCLEEESAEDDLLGEDEDWLGDGDPTGEEEEGSEDMNL